MHEDRTNIAKAFIAKAEYNFETTEILIEYLRGCKNLRRLCGWEYSWDVPSRATFSRAFAEFTDGNLMQAVHEAMVKRHCGDKLAGHNSRDSTAIEAREKVGSPTDENTGGELGRSTESVQCRHQE